MSTGFLQYEFPGSYSIFDIRGFNNDKGKRDISKRRQIKFK